jgi:molybdenum cofactor cytidylyltransferase
VSALSSDATPKRGAIAGIVLAGGASRRMGVPKAGLVHDGRTFLARVLGTLHDASVVDVVIVSGSAHDAVLAALPAGETGLVLRNPDPDRGQLSSLKVALEALCSRIRPPQAALVTLVDHPLVAPSTVVRLIDAWLRGVVSAERTSAASIVLPTHHGRRGHPVLFAASLWDELLATPDERGARAVVHADPTRVREVAVDDPGVCIDVDTPDDFRRLTGAAD